MFDDGLRPIFRRRIAGERWLEIVSEASQHLLAEAKARHPHIQGRGVAAQ